MQRKDEIERQKEHALKAVRAAIRLKYSILADDEIARVLPDVEDEINAAIAEGKPLELSPADYWAEAA